MSDFNLDRFRYEKKTDGGAASSRGPDPAVTTIPETPEGKQKHILSHFKRNGNGKGVLFLESESENEDLPKNSSSCSEMNGKIKDRTEKINGAVDVPSDSVLTEANGSSLDCSDTFQISTDTVISTDTKLQKLREIFPSRSVDELMQVIESTSTLDAAIAIIIFREQATPRKRKLSTLENNSSDESDDLPISIATKKKKTNRLESQDSIEDYEKKDSLLRKLHNKFPGLDKEELREVLEEHDWSYWEALEALQVFANEDSDEVPCEPEPENVNGKVAISNFKTQPKKRYQCSQNQLDQKKNRTIKLKSITKDKKLAE